MSNLIQSVLIDHREPPWMRRLAYEGVTTVIGQLNCGDVWIGTTDGALLIVERKTAEDLLASIADGRLFEQAAAMVQVSPWAYIVVQGVITPTTDGKARVNGTDTNWHWSSIQGALQTVQELGVAVVYVSAGARDFWAFLDRLAKRERGSVRANGARKPQLLDPGMLVLMGLPGIGETRAKLLIEQAGSAAWALVYLTDLTWQSNITGIGDETKNKVRAALGLEPTAALVIQEIQP